MVLNKTNNLKKGFTLLELLIVIGILAILSAVTILVINPAELLRKSRDTQRISDLGSINSALGFYLTNTSTISMGSVSSSYSVTSTTCSSRTPAVTTSQSVAGTGWLPVDLATLAVGSPISKYPVDPNPSYTGNNQRYYVYLTDGAGKWEIVANLESAYYTSTDDRESKDGGNENSLYEVGNKLDLLNTSANCYWAYNLRDVGPAGGLVFYDQGSYINGWRYLEAAPSDQGAGIVWHATLTGDTEAHATAVGTGNANTNLIVALYGAENNAAKLCSDLVINGYSDWFLPSKDELDLMYHNLKEQGAGGFTGSSYWSSSEGSANDAWYQAFGSGYQDDVNKNNTGYVRAVRAF